MPELKLENSLVDGRYEVRERLSRGSYAEIFVAYDRELGRDVVIKALNTSLQGTPDADLERTLVENFQNEAVALDAVRHPHVILRWSHGTAADLGGVPFHYLVLEYMPGGDLLRMCRSNPGSALPLDRALFYFKQICEALAYAHGKGIIHRDLKPNNFLLSADCKTLKIADFGVAKITTGEDTEITRVGADLYAPPEHHPDEVAGQFNRLTAAADIYSLAKSFYTTVCGRAPNLFKADAIAFLPDGMMKESWAEPLLAVLKRATDDEPAKRYSTVVEFWSDLAQVAPVVEGDVEEAEEADTETIVRPRLQVNPGALPAKPIEPEFDPALASTASLTTYTSATPVKSRLDAPVEVQVQVVEPPAAKDRDREKPSKVFIELRNPKPAPVIEPPADHAPPAGRGGQKASAKELEAQTAAQRAADRFTEALRRRVFIGLLVAAFTGSLVSVYNFVRAKDTPFGFGPPTEIEVVAQRLNVRTDPGQRGEVLGEVGKTSRHKVLATIERGWLQIEVSQWSEMYLQTNTNTGWIYGNLDGNPAYVRVVSRRWW
ncbi:MAG: protein kinase domain-containing protein [Blastocatellia bacterium]